MKKYITLLNIISFIKSEYFKLKPRHKGSSDKKKTPKSCYINVLQYNITRPVNRQPAVKALHISVLIYQPYKELEN